MTPLSYPTRYLWSSTFVMKLVCLKGIYLPALFVDEGLSPHRLSSTFLLPPSFSFLIHPPPFSLSLSLSLSLSHTLLLVPALLPSSSPPMLRVPCDVIEGACSVECGGPNTLVCDTNPWTFDTPTTKKVRVGCVWLGFRGTERDCAKLC